MAKVVATRIKRALYRSLEDVADEQRKNISDVVKEAIYEYMAYQDSIELSNTMKKIVERNEVYRRAEEEILFDELENKRIKIESRKNTFRRFVDNSLAHVFTANFKDMTEKEVEEMLKDHLEVFRAKAQHYDMEEVIENRKDDPIQYAKRRLDEWKNDDTP